MRELDLIILFSREKRLHGDLRAVVQQRRPRDPGQGLILFIGPYHACPNVSVFWFSGNLVQERSVCDVVDASESLRRESMVVEALPHDKARMLRSISSI